MIKPMNYAAADLLAFADQLLQTAGLPPDKAQAVAELLLLGDLLGHTTHRLALLAPHLAALEEGQMFNELKPLSVSDAPADVTWEVQRRPSPWLRSHRYVCVNTTPRPPGARGGVRV